MDTLVHLVGDGTDTSTELMAAAWAAEGLDPIYKFVLIVVAGDLTDDPERISARTGLSVRYAEYTLERLRAMGTLR